MMTKKGRPVRADFRLDEHQEPERLVWHQELAGTPFERLLREARTEVRLNGDEHRGETTTVTIELLQRLRGWSRFGGFLFRRAARVQLDEALDSLERACGR